MNASFIATTWAPLSTAARSTRRPILPKLLIQFLTWFYAACLAGIWLCTTAFRRQVNEWLITDPQLTKISYLLKHKWKIMIQATYGIVIQLRHSLQWYYFILQLSYLYIFVTSEWKNWFKHVTWICINAVVIICHI